MPLTRFSPEGLPTMREFTARALSPSFSKRLAAAMHTKLVMSLPGDEFQALYEDAATAKSVEDLQPEHRALLRQAVEELDGKAPWTAQQEQQHPRDSGRFAAKPGQAAGDAKPDEGSDHVDLVLNNVTSVAKKNEALLSPVVKDAVKSSGGRLEGYPDRLRPVEALMESVQRASQKMPGAKPEDIAQSRSDALRYVGVYPADQMAQGVRAALAALDQKGFQAHRVTNYWQPGDIYNGINAQFVNPATGFKFQMQFHTDESWDRKQQVALLAQHFGEATDDKERKMLWDQMVKASDSIPAPSRILEIGTLAQTATPQPQQRGTGTAADPFASSASTATAAAAPAAAGKAAAPPAADPGTVDPFAPDTSPTALAPSPPSDAGPATPEEDAAARASDPTSPAVAYYVYQLDRNGEPYGIMRVVSTADSGMRIDRVDTNGQWIEDNTLIPDLGAADPMNDNSDWDYVSDSPEVTARQVYDQHFGKDKTNPDAPPATQTEQSQPASGQATPPQTFATDTGGAQAASMAQGGKAPGDGVPVFLDNSYVLNRKQAEALREFVGGDAEGFVPPALFELDDDHPFYAGLSAKVVFVPSDHPRYPHGTPGGLGGKFRPKIRVNVGGKEVEIVDDVSVPNEPPVPPEVVAKIKLLGVDKGIDTITKGEKARQLLGDARDTEQLYQVNGEYTPARAAMHQRLIDSLFEGHSPKPEGQRTAVFAAGGTASGKSSTFRADPSLLPPDTVQVNADDFKTMLPEWTHMTGETPDPYASVAVHEESSYLAKLATAKALREGYNVFVDGTGNSGPGKFVGKLDAAHASGHKIEVLFVDVPTNTAIDRMVKRGEDEKRYVPIPELKAAHHGAISRMPEWMHSAKVSRYSIWRTTKNPPTLVATGGGGVAPTIHNPQEWAGIIAKPGEEGDVAQG